MMSKTKDAHIKINKRFNSIIKIAKEVAIKNPDALVHLIKILGRKRQTREIMKIIENDSEHPRSKISPDSLWFNQRYIIKSTNTEVSKLKHEIKENIYVNLATDLVLTGPWKHQRMINALSEHGKGYKRGEWKQDHKNHLIEVWLPQKIAWVQNGYHSISAGIIRSEGKVKAEIVYDISEYYKYIHTDGINFYETKTKKKISSVQDIEFAAIYEIGRLMLPKK